MGALGVTSSLPKPRRAKAVVCNRLSPRAYEKGPVAQNGAEVKTARPLPPRFVTPWATACQAFLSFTDSHSLLKLMSTEMWGSELEGGKWSWGEDEMGQRLFKQKRDLHL